MLFGAKNIHDTFRPEKIEQVIRKNQSVIGFNLPSLPAERIGNLVPGLLELIARGRVKPIARHAFALADFRHAFQALANRDTVGKVVIAP